MKYKIGDVVQMNSMWDNRYGIIIDIDHINKEFQPVYRIHVQGNSSPGWMSEFVIVRKVE